MLLYGYKVILIKFIYLYISGFIFFLKAECGVERSRKIFNHFSGYFYLFNREHYK